jgi:hypothetical protein
MLAGVRCIFQPVKVEQQVGEECLLMYTVSIITDNLVAPTRASVLGHSAEVNGGVGRWV